MTKCICGSYFFNRARYIWVRSTDETFLRRTSSPSSRTVAKASAFRSFGTSLPAIAGLRCSGLRMSVPGGGGVGYCPGGSGSKLNAGGTELAIFNARRSSYPLRLVLSAASMAAFWSGAIGTPATTAASSIIPCVMRLSSACAARL
jgi:hypothetical protein